MSSTGNLMLLTVLLGVLASCSSATSGPDEGEGGGNADDLWLSSTLVASDAQVRIDRVSYMSDGLRINGQVCRPSRDGRHPIVVINHGGWEGLGSDSGALDGACGTIARLGNIAVMSSYRGEDGSQGNVEFCGGEASDVRHMLDIVRGASFADGNRVVMYGASHGGCVTLRALLDGAPVQRAVTWNGPTDVAGLYGNAQARAVSGGIDTPRSFFVELLAAMNRAFGGPPDQHGNLYAERSTLASGPALARLQTPLLIQHGEADDVVPLLQSCQLAVAMGGFTAFFIAADGRVIPEAPGPCAGLPLTWKRDGFPSGNWTGSRYLVVYQGQGHAMGPSTDRMLQHLLGFLRIP